MKLLLLVYFLIGTGFVLFRPAFSDEGYYIWAAQNVLHGKLMYVDFIFHQLPLILFLYAPFSDFGVASIIILKYISIFFTAGLAVLLYKHVLRVAGDHKSAYFAVTLLIFNGLFVDFNSIARMFAPSNFLCYLSFYLVTLVKFDSSLKDRLLLFCTGLVMSLASNMRIMFWTAAAVISFYAGYSVFKRIKGAEQKYSYVLLLLAGIMIPTLVTAFYLFNYTDYFVFGIYRHNLYSQKTAWADGGTNLAKWLKFFLIPQNFLLFVFMLYALMQKIRYKALAISIFAALLASHSIGYYIDEYFTVLIPYIIFVSAVNYRSLEKKLIYRGRSFIKYALFFYILGFFISVPYFRYALTGRVMEPNFLQLNEMLNYERSLKGEKILSSWYVYSLYSNKVEDKLNNDYIYSTMIRWLSKEEIRKYDLPDSASISNLIKDRYYDVIVRNETTPHVLLQHKDLIEQYYRPGKVFGNTKYYVK